MKCLQLCDIFMPRNVLCVLSEMCYVLSFVVHL